MIGKVVEFLKGDGTVKGVIVDKVLTSERNGHGDILRLEMYVIRATDNTCYVINPTEIKKIY